MRGSYNAKLVDEEIKREKRKKENIFRKTKCSKCKNKSTGICHITKDIEGNYKCVNYEE